MKFTTNKNCSITIFLSLILTCIISILFSILELTRMQVAKLYYQVASNSSIDSMLSLYHRKLWDNYNIFAVEFDDTEKLEKEYYDFIKNYFYNYKFEYLIDNLLSANISKEDIKINVNPLIKETNFENSILQYMRYGIFGKIINFLGEKTEIKTDFDISDMVDKMNDLKTKENVNLEKIGKEYFNYNNVIDNIDSISKKINKDSKELKDKMKKLRQITVSSSYNDLYDLNVKLENVLIFIKNVYSDMDSYEKKLLELNDLIETSYDRYQNDKNSSEVNFTDEMQYYIEEKFNDFRKYADINNEVNSKIIILKDQIYNVEIEYEKKLSEINDLLEKYKNLNEELESAKNDKDTDPDTLKDIREAIRDIKEEVKDYLEEAKNEFKDADYNFTELTTSGKDTNNYKKKLSDLLNLSDDIIMQLIFTNEQLSKISKENYIKNTNSIDSNMNIFGFDVIDKFLIGEYSLDFFNNYINNANNKFEVEYILKNKNSDYENLKGVILDILLIREGANLFYIYSNASKREMVRAFTYSTFSFLTPIACEVIVFTVISALAFAQSILDVKHLVNNEYVRFMHNDESFDFDIKNIFLMNFEIQKKNDNREFGTLCYIDYLRILLFAKEQKSANSNMADLIEYNLGKEQKNFKFSKLFYEITANVVFHTGHFLLNNKFENSILNFNYDENITSYGDFNEVE